MKRFVVLGLALAGITGCGGATHTVTVTSASRSSTADTKAPPNEPKPCRQADVQQVSECLLEGSLIKLAHGSAPLRLESLTARVTSIRTAPTTSGGSGFTAVAKGIFLLITLSVTNHSPSPQTFDSLFSHQTVLAVEQEGKEISYTESFEAENGKDAKAFSADSEDIQPGETQIGEVVFDVPRSTVPFAMASAHSGLIITNFGIEAEKETPTGSGVITLRGA